MSIPYTLNENSITYYVNGRQNTLASDHPNFDDVVVAVLKGEADVVEQLLNVRTLVVKATFGKVTIRDDDQVYFEEQKVPEYLASRIVQLYTRDFPVDSLIHFAEKLMENPNHDVREDLYKWLEVGKMPIYSDGDFVAYKLVRDDFSPIFSGPYGKDQSPGKIVEMPRNKCNENRNDTCSEGLHFCSYEYLPIFQNWNSNMGQRVILLKINPRDVVAIPTDYNLSKGRCCRFEVIESIDPNKIKEHFGNKLVLSVAQAKSITKEDNKPKKVKDNSLQMELDRQIFDAYVDSGKSQQEIATIYEVSRSTVARAIARHKARMLDGIHDTPKLRVERAIEENNGNKTAAAKALGIPRSTLYKWLAS